MTDDLKDRQLVLDIIEVHGREAAGIARENARAAALGGSSRAGQVLD